MEPVLNQVLSNGDGKKVDEEKKKWREYLELFLSYV